MFTDPATCRGWRNATRKGRRIIKRTCGGTGWFDKPSCMGWKRSYRHAWNIIKNKCDGGAEPPIETEFELILDSGEIGEGQVSLGKFEAGTIVYLYPAWIVDGKKIKEYNTKPDGTGFGWTSTASFMMPANDVTLYAIWVPWFQPTDTFTIYMAIIHMPLILPPGGTQSIVQMYEVPSNIADLTPNDLFNNPTLITNSQFQLLINWSIIEGGTLVSTDVQTPTQTWAGAGDYTFRDMGFFDYIESGTNRIFYHVLFPLPSP